MSVFSFVLLWLLLLFPCKYNIFLFIAFLFIYRSDARHFPFSVQISLRSNIYKNINVSDSEECYIFFLFFFSFFLLYFIFLCAPSPKTKLMFTNESSINLSHCLTWIYKEFEMVTECRSAAPRLRGSAASVEFSGRTTQKASFSHGPHKTAERNLIIVKIIKCMECVDGLQKELIYF